MFLHNFKYSLKTLFKNKLLIFWTYAFPIIMATLFYMAFSNIEDSEKLSIIDIAVVDNSEYQADVMFSQAIEQLSDKDNEHQLFQTQYVKKEKAKELLESEKILGYIELSDGNPKVYVVDNSIEATILKYAVDEIIQTKNVMEDALQKDIADMKAEGKVLAQPEMIYQKVSEHIYGKEANIENISPNNLSYTMIEFYTLIAMACLYSGMLGMTAVNNNMPNMGAMGKRVSVSPISKMKLVFSSVMASYITQLIGLALLYIYTIFALDVDYGDNLPFIVLLSLAGSLAGVSLGIIVGALIKAGENAKTGIIISVTMVGCFLSGMMGITMKYIIDTNVPILNKINPAAMITDGLYSLYYYGVNERFYIDVLSLLVFSVILIGLSFVGLRRQKYDSI